MAQHGSFPASIVTKPDLARCGPCATILWYQGRAKTDSYGRLPIDADSLAFEVMRPQLSQGTYTREEVAAARDQLAVAALWHCYEVDGQVYAEYAGWDDDHPARSSLKMRGRPQHPDDPARPELSWLQRPHKPGKYDQQQPQLTAPYGSADLPAGPPEVPPSRVVVAPVVAATQQAERTLEPPQPKPLHPVMEIPDGFAQLGQAHLQHSGQPLRTDDQTKLLGVLRDAMAAGVEWQTLLTIMRDKQKEFKPTTSTPCIKGIGYYLLPWDKHIRAAMQERDAERPPARSSLAPPVQLDTEDPRERIRKKMAAVTGGATHAAV